MIFTRLVSFRCWDLCLMRVVKEWHRGKDETETIDNLLENISYDGEQRNVHSIERDVDSMKV